MAATSSVSIFWLKRPLSSTQLAGLILNRSRIVLLAK